MPTYEVLVKSVAPVMVASVRDVVADFKAIPQLYNELAGSLQPFNFNDTTYCAGIWYDLEYKKVDVDWEAAAALDGNKLSLGDRLKIYELPGVEKMACAVHQGRYNSISQAYTTVLSWIESNGYKVVGANREVYIIGGNEQDNETYVTEVQFPVEKS